MADNTAQNGTATIRTDDIGGVHFPTSKLTLGADGVDGGFVSAANPLPMRYVDAGGSFVTLPIGATAAAAPSTAQAMGGVDASGNLQIPRVDVILGQTPRMLWNVATISSPGAAARGGFAYVNAYGSLRVSPESTNLFNESYDAAIDTTSKWTTVLSGGTVTFTNGIGTVQTSTAASSYAVLRSLPTFTNLGSTFLVYGTVVQLGGPTTGSYRCWGIGTHPATPTTAAPVTDFIGFECDTTGALYAVIYAGGTNVYRSAALTAPGTAWNRYGFQMRPDIVIFYYGTTEYAVASTNFTLPNSTTLPVLSLAVAGGAALASAAQVLQQSSGIGDSGKNSTQLSDGAMPWRKATVKAASQAAASTDGALVVAPSPARRTTYMVTTTTTITLATLTAGAIQSLLYAFHGAANAQRVELVRFEIGLGGGTGGALSFRLNRITAENGTPGGTALTAVAADSADSFTALNIRQGATGAPTRGTDFWTQSLSAAYAGAPLVWTPSDVQKPLILRAGVAEGYEIRSVVDVAITTSPRINLSMTFVVDA